MELVMNMKPAGSGRYPKAVRLPDELTRCPLTVIKDRILEYQRTRDEILFTLLFNRFDGFIYYVCIKFRRRFSFLEGVDMRDLYQNGVVALHKSFISMPESWKEEMILQRIKSYIRQELITAFNSKVVRRTESVDPVSLDCVDLKSHQDFEDKICCSNLLDILSEQDRDLIMKKVMQNYSYEELRKEYGGISKQALSTKVCKILKKIRHLADK